MRAKRTFRAAMMTVLSLGFAGTLFAWGEEGHRITAQVAQNLLSGEVKTAALAILDGESLAQAATWPDEIRSYPSWDCAKPYHFVTVRPGDRYPDRDVWEGDSVEALVYFIGVLTSPEARAGDHKMALSFVVHLVGDMHQPLHNGRGCDLGGNALKVSWFGETQNFHTVWDSLLIQSEDLSFTEWAEFLSHDGDVDSCRVTGQQQDEHDCDLDDLRNSTPFDWIVESQERLDGAYTCFTQERCPCFCGDCDDGKSAFGGCRAPSTCSLSVNGPAVMSYTYKAVNLPVVREQLLKGGVRLANLLTWVLDESVAPPDAFLEMAATLEALEPDTDPKRPEEFARSTQKMASCRGESTIQRHPLGERGQ